ncbi:unnamed protein product [Polarella glacialis]|uniref:Nicotinamide phosphoribosyltransferase n=1 Tax=Polarella glacialis TaxID=89957 RepID=A0A813HVC3_POLGL|nr:unnamed protein product [Polarella glacialis]CAE8689086.1 unnamed protein product [Polarella glacialis]|mmetsp:Transcript_37369/g.60181  ORF Transcript_37369/g.60181 Transcript_37369/m.60181 type:complete len:567 (-) Transcript_37369:217-1917(-)
MGQVLTCVNRDTGNNGAAAAPVDLDNIIMLTDSYKVSHYVQYPEGTEEVYSYFESRGFDSTQVAGHPTVCFFGLQYFIKRYLEGPVVTLERINRAQTFFDKHFLGTGAKFNREGWMHILQEHGGCLPIEIRAVAEGTEVPTSTVLFTLRSTDPKAYWLTNYLETLLVQVWYPMTVATNSMYQRRMLLEYLKETGTPELIDFKLVDFGFRGVSSVESAAIGDLSHLVSFCSTDVISGIVAAQAYYGADMPGASIPASEHSTITSWGRENETDAMRNMLVKYPTGLVACVSDSYNIYDAIDKKYGQELKDLICSRDGVLVVRPDSGEPAEIVPELLEKLDKAFAAGTCGKSPGTTVNAKGYKVLDPHVRLLQGDGVNTQTVLDILEIIKKKKYSTDNVTFGSGGALLQRMDRDTQKIAFKCCQVVVKGKTVDVYKDPIHDKGKKSKMGEMFLIRDSTKPVKSPENRPVTDPNRFAGNCYDLTTVCHYEGGTKRAVWASDLAGKAGRADPATIGRSSPVAGTDKEKDAALDLLVPVFKNGKCLLSYTLADVRKRAASSWPGDPGCSTLQ